MKENLLFCPLGGSGEIGMNMNLYAYGKPGKQKWIIVDVGVTFADDSLPGIDLIYPDPGFIVDKKDDLLGIVLTHAHEDHIGAIAHIWPKLKCKIYATPFTAVLISEKFKFIPKSMIMPIIHCMKNAPTNNNRLKDVRAFPALVNEKAIPTAG